MVDPYKQLLPYVCFFRVHFAVLGGGRAFLGRSKCLGKVVAVELHPGASAQEVVYL